MKTIPHRKAWMLVVALATLVGLAACTPLPAYDTQFTVTFQPATGDPVTLVASQAERPGIFGDLAAEGAQDAALWIFIDNGLEGDDALAYWYWRYQNSADVWVEELRVRYAGGIYASASEIPTDDAAAIPDNMEVVDYQDGVGLVTGDIASYTVEETDTSATLTVMLDGLDALAYSSDANGGGAPIE